MPETRVALAGVYRTEKSYTKAMELYEKALLEYAGTNNRVAEVYIDEAQMMEEQNVDPNKVLEAYEKALAADADYAPGYYYVGKFLSTNKKAKDKAKDALEEYLKRDKAGPSPLAQPRSSRRSTNGCGDLVMAGDRQPQRPLRSAGADQAAHHPAGRGATSAVASGWPRRISSISAGSSSPCWVPCSWCREPTSSNMYVERDLDGLMERTRTRPLPAGRLPRRGLSTLGWDSVRPHFRSWSSESTPSPGCSLRWRCSSTSASTLR